MSVLWWLWHLGAWWKHLTLTGYTSGKMTRVNEANTKELGDNTAVPKEMGFGVRQAWI